MLDKNNDPNAILNKIKLMMNYQLGKTLEEQTPRPRPSVSGFFSTRNNIESLADIIPFYDEKGNIFIIPKGYKNGDYDKYNGQHWSNVCESLGLQATSDTFNKAWGILKQRSKEWYDDKEKRIIYGVHRLVGNDGRTIKKIGSALNGTLWVDWMKRKGINQEKVNQIDDYVKKNPEPIPKPVGISLIYPNIPEPYPNYIPNGKKIQQPPAKTSGTTRNISGVTKNTTFTTNEKFPLQVGQKGAKISTMQKALGFMNPDGKFGMKTFAAIKQRLNQLGVSYNNEAITPDLYNKIVNSPIMRVKKAPKQATPSSYDTTDFDNFSTDQSQASNQRLSLDIPNITPSEIKPLETGQKNLEKRIPTNMNQYLQQKQNLNRLMGR